MSNRYDKQGKPLPFKTPEEIKKVNDLLCDDDYKRVDFTTIGGTDISTVWLGLDHYFGNADISEGHTPVIFETMIFSDNEALDQKQRRYSTLEEAQAGHKSACEYAKKVLLSNVE